MQIEFDPVKSAKNERERNLPFAAAIRLFDNPRLEREDRRRDYGEVRINTLGEIDGEVHFATFTWRGEAIRIISFRKANARETRRYRQYVGERGEGSKGRLG
jgi:uncharacterized DUF497 family protein